jgi:anti-sigma B factor antagonist
MMVVPLELEQVGEVTLVRIAGTRLLDGPQVDALARSLLGLAEDPGRARMVLDFEAVELLSTAVLPALLALRKALQAQGGGLALCGLRPAVREVFAITGLERTLNVFATQQEALRSIRQRP